MAVWIKPSEALSRLVEGDMEVYDRVSRAIPTERDGRISAHVSLYNKNTRRMILNRLRRYTLSYTGKKISAGQAKSYMMDMVGAFAEVTGHDSRFDMESSLGVKTGGSIYLCRHPVNDTILMVADHTTDYRHVGSKPRTREMVDTVLYSAMAYSVLAQAAQIDHILRGSQPRCNEYTPHAMDSAHFDVECRSYECEQGVPFLGYRIARSSSPDTFRLELVDAGEVRKAVELETKTAF